MLIVDIGHIRYDEEIYPESDVRLGFGYLIALCSPAISVPKFQVLLTGTRVHSVIFVISLKLNIFPFSASIRTKMYGDEDGKCQLCKVEPQALGVPLWFSLFH
jgi:hypothetical protein